MTKKFYHTTIAPNQTKVVKIPIGSLPTGVPIKIPVYIYNSGIKGPTVLLQGGLHGDEINGVEICKQLITQEHFTQLKKGCVIIVPLLNVYGFIHFSRDLPDGKDVNRSFPGTKNGSLASRIAHFVTSEIIPLIDFGIDFHTGGAQRDNYPQIRYTPNCGTSKELATAFNAPLQFESKLIPKSFRAIAAKHHKPIIIFEGGESMRFNKKAIEVGITGTLKMLASQGMLDYTTSPLPSLAINDRKWLRAKKAGIFIPEVKNGATIEKNQLLGRITDAYGNETLLIKAPYTGIVICINNHPLVNQGDALLHIGKHLNYKNDYTRNSQQIG